MLRICPDANQPTAARAKRGGIGRIVRFNDDDIVTVLGKTDRYGKQGVLRTGGKTTGYYSSASGSIGLQLGISTRSLVIMFLTDEALKKFMESSGWEAGVDAQVAVIQSGATGSYDTISAQNPVVAFNFGEQGLMAGVSLEGTKVSKLED